MGKLGKIKDDYLSRSSRASEICRTLSLAGIGIIWIFKNTDNELSTVPLELVKPLWLFAISLALDMLHYVFGTISWGIFYRITRKKVVIEKLSEDAIERPEWISIAIWLFWGAKILAMFIAYKFLISFLYIQMNLGQS